MNQNSPDKWLSRVRDNIRKVITSYVLLSEIYRNKEATLSELYGRKEFTEADKDNILKEYDTPLDTKWNELQIAVKNLVNEFNNNNKENIKKLLNDYLLDQLKNYRPSLKTEDIEQVIGLTKASNANKPPVSATPVKSRGVLNRLRGMFSRSSGGTRRRRYSKERFSRKRSSRVRK